MAVIDMQELRRELSLGENATDVDVAEALKQRKVLLWTDSEHDHFEFMIRGLTSGMAQSIFDLHVYAYQRFATDRHESGYNYTAISNKDG